jgi:hypothetical protein
MKKEANCSKGQALENWLSDQIIEIGLDERAKRSKGSGSGTGEKADIKTSLTICGRNAGIECKNHNVPHIKDWWSQTQKLEKLSREPILIYKLESEEMGEAKAVIYASTLLELIKASKCPTEKLSQPKGGFIKNTRQPLIWAAKSAVSALKKVISELEKIKD